MRTFKLTITEDELKCLINFNCNRHYSDMSVEMSSRIHDLTKRLHKNIDDKNETEEQPVAEINHPKIEGWN